MTFQDLSDAITRLAADPRVHPNTAIEVRYPAEDAVTKDHWHENEPLAHVAIRDHTIVLSSEAVEPAIAR